MSSEVQLNYKGIRFGTAAIDAVSGQAALDGGQLLLGVRLRLDARAASQQIRIYGVTGTLMLTKPPRFAAPIYPFNSVHAATSERSQDSGHASIGVLLTAAALASIEEARLTAPDDDVAVQLRLEFTCDAPEGNDTAQAWIDHTFSQSSWAKVLAEMQIEQRFAIEVPVLGGRVSGPLALAAEHFRRAIEQQKKCAWVQSVAESRKVVEAIKDALRLENPARAEWVSGSQDWPLGKRIEHARASIHHVFHPSNHPGVSDDPGPHEAQLALALAGSLLRYYASRDI